MSPNDTPNATGPPPKRQKRKCSLCGQVGHDKRNCPSLNKDTPANQRPNHESEQNDRENANEIGPEVTVLNNLDSEDIDIASLDSCQVAEFVHVRLEDVLYCVFDLETTGFSRERDDIIEISSVLLTPDGIQIEDSTFTSFCKPSRRSWS